jgi:hypothetical protein
MFICRSYGGGYARLINFQSRESDAFCMEFTDSHLRLINDNSLLVQNDSGSPKTISSYATGIYTLSGTHGWSVGDQLLIFFPSSFDIDDMAGFQNAILTIASVPATNEVTIVDDNAVPVQTSSIVGAALRKVINLATPWTAAQLPDLRSIQATTQAVLLHGSVAPQVLKPCQP